MPRVSRSHLISPWGKAVGRLPLTHRRSALKPGRGTETLWPDSRRARASRLSAEYIFRAFAPFASVYQTTILLTKRPN